MDKNTRDILLKELVEKQIKNIKGSRKLSFHDLEKIVVGIPISIFDENCCIWTKHIKKNIKTKQEWINFYFNKEKTALHRLLYENYIGELTSEDHIKYKCGSHGGCCNVTHMIKYKYNYTNKTNESIKNEDNIKDETQQIEDIKKKLQMIF